MLEKCLRVLHYRHPVLVVLNGHECVTFALADRAEGEGPKSRCSEQNYNLTKVKQFIFGWKKGTKKKGRCTLRPN